MTRLMEKAHTTQSTVENIKVSGSLICGRERAMKSFKTVLAFKANIDKTKRMGKASFTGQMEIHTQVSSSITSEKGRES
jgi:hypothetical protein